MILELESERKEEERRGAEVVVNCRLARAVAAEGARRRRGRQRAIVTLCLCAAWVATTWAATTWARVATSWSLCICCYTTGRRTRARAHAARATGKHRMRTRPANHTRRALSKVELSLGAGMGSQNECTS